MLAWSLSVQPGRWIYYQQLLLSQRINSMYITELYGGYIRRIADAYRDTGLVKWMSISYKHQTACVSCRLTSHINRHSNAMFPLHSVAIDKRFLAVFTVCIDVEFLY